ncbi:tripartite-type tricarboxylate transporter receptor subunit TctC [Salirhabdus euzebyi]|uniref:Tripartite-type tricarboxylate transporter receptor subunit TctC n=1 Tax=Salirhabdus euzebyi TaxID=394506 RepID=A0A841Q806_9BACI|nr:tripartite tricarboxylate transporter substrate binding protein [Salirhabdus euzebyi]MBB6454581.1 tripartite-type tricarboxylate transporter receptor subunit TctC [Salirhabdus euzebyi]
MKKWYLMILVLFIALLAACSSEANNSGGENETEDNTQDSNEESKYPNKQIELVVPYSPGGASDMVGRTVGSFMEKELGVPVVVTNKTGGTGAVGMSYVEGKNPDGYGIGYVPVEMSMVKALGFADVEPANFELLGRAIVIPAAVTVPADAPYDTIEEFIQYAKDNPGQIRVGNSGTGSIWHIAAAGLAEETGAEFKYVPFDGAAPAVAALLGGHIEAVSVSPSEVKANVDGGDLKILAVMSSDRDPTFPDVPTLIESGIDLEIAAWGGFAAPKGIPDDVKSVLEEAVKKAVASEEFQTVSTERGLNASYLSAEEFTDFASKQFDFYNELIPNMDLQ